LCGVEITNYKSKHVKTDLTLYALASSINALMRKGGLNSCVIR